MKKVGEITIRNRSVRHYLLSLLAFTLDGASEIRLKSYGSLMGKSADIANLLTRNFAVDAFQISAKNHVEKVRLPSLTGEKDYCEASVSTISLRFLHSVDSIVESITPTASGTEPPLSQISIFDLELLLALFKRSGANVLQLGVEEIDYEGKITPFDLDLAKLDLATHDLVPGEDVMNPNRAYLDIAALPKGDKTRVETEKRIKKLTNIRSAFTDALIRTGLLRPDVENYAFHLAKWDDVILGLDTNLFYQCAPTAYLLDSLMKIPSGDFIDTPDWLTLVVSKVCVAEIQYRAHRSPTSWDRRESLRAVQEIMILSRSKDLEGVSLFMVGSVPPEIDFTRPETTTMRDFLIREQFRNFLKQLDFYKGSYFATADFDNATLAEAEGLASLYLKKPLLCQAQYQVPAGEVNVSEVLYELATAFEPLLIKGDGLKLLLHSTWEGKTLENWENWELQVEWIEDKHRLQAKCAEVARSGAIAQVLKACHNMRYRFVTWAK